MTDDMKSAEAAAYLGIHPRSLQRLVKLRKIPHRKIGGHAHFRRSELDAWWALQPGVSVEEAADNMTAAQPLRLAPERRRPESSEGSSS